MTSVLGAKYSTAAKHLIKTDLIRIGMHPVLAIRRVSLILKTMSIRAMEA